MRKLSAVVCVLAALALLGLAGCASRAPRKHLAASSTADLSYTKSIHKLFITAEIPSSGGELFYLRGESTLVSRTDPERKKKLYQVYANFMENKFKKIGIDSHCELPSGLELDESDLVKKIAAFSPDAVLTIKCTSVKISQSSISSSSYDVSLRDYPSEKRVWRGQIDVSSAFSPYTDSLANDIFITFIDQLGEDKMNILGTIEK